MPTYEQLPGSLSLAFRAGDDVATVVDFSIPLTGYSVLATLHSVVTDQQIMSFTTVITDANAGQVSVSLTDSQTAALAVGTYRWRMVATQGTVTRTYIQGLVEVTA